MITPIARGFVCAGYSNHVACCTDQWGNIYAVFTRSEEGQAPGLIIRRRQQGTGVWTTIAEMGPGVIVKYGYAALAVVGAHLVLLTPERQPDGSTPQREFLLPGAVTQVG